MDKILYVIAGPNGAGKTQVIARGISDLIPMINADLFQRQILGSNEVSNNEEADALFVAQKKIKEYMDNGQSFCFESNMARNEDWLFLKEAKEMGYKIDLHFVSVDNLDTLNERIKIRYAINEAHYVDPGTVEFRYINGLTRLDYYFGLPDKLTLTDSSGDPSVVLIAECGTIIFRADVLPNWVKLALNSKLEEVAPQQKAVNQMESIEEVRQRLKEISPKNEVDDDDDEDSEPILKKNKGPKR